MAIAAAPAPAPEVLGELRANTSALVAAEIRRAELVVSWVSEHRVDDEVVVGGGRTGDLSGRGLVLAGEGAPVVDDLEFCSLATALGQSVDGATARVGEIVELAFRLPQLWQRVLAGQVRLWRGQRVAGVTMGLNAAAAAWVDRQVAAVVTSCSTAQLERTAAAAADAYDPAAAEQRRREAADRRRFDVHLREAGDPFDEVSCATVRVDGLLDPADALDLEAAVRSGATAVGRMQPDVPENVRRSIAAGELARGQQPLPAAIGFEEAGRPSQTESTGDRARGSTIAPTHRTVNLYLHLDATVLDGAFGGAGGEAPDATGASLGVGRCENTRSPVTAEQVRQWCQSADRVLVRPVIDLADNPRTDAYEPTGRMREQVIVRDGHCVFPYCSRSARRADLDHITPFEDGGPTEPANLAPLCRRHHRAKTFTDWDYAQPAPGTYLWCEPGGYSYLVTGAGTVELPATGAPPR